MTEQMFHLGRRRSIVPESRFPGDSQARGWLVVRNRQHGIDSLLEGSCDISPPSGRGLAAPAHKPRREASMACSPPPGGAVERAVSFA